MTTSVRRYQIVAALLPVIDGLTRSVKVVEQGEYSSFGLENDSAVSNRRRASDAGLKRARFQGQTSPRLLKRSFSAHERFSRVSFPACSEVACTSGSDTKPVYQFHVDRPSEIVAFDGSSMPVDQNLRKPRQHYACGGNACTFRWRYDDHDFAVKVLINPERDDADEDDDDDDDDDYEAYLDDHFNCEIDSEMHLAGVLPQDSTLVRPVLAYDWKKCGVDTSTKQMQQQGATTAAQTTTTTTSSCHHRPVNPEFAAAARDALLACPIAICKMSQDEADPQREIRENPIFVHEWRDRSLSHHFSSMAKRVFAPTKAGEVSSRDIPVGRAEQWFSTRDILKVARGVVDGLQLAADSMNSAAKNGKNEAAAVVAMAPSSPSAVHHDVKPGNVLINLDENGGIGEVTLIDFGSLKRGARSAYYVLPGARKNFKDINLRSDIYSLGLILLQMFVYRAYFQVTGDGERYIPWRDTDANERNKAITQAIKQQRRADPIAKELGELILRMIPKNNHAIIKFDVLQNRLVDIQKHLDTTLQN